MAHGEAITTNNFNSANGMNPIIFSKKVALAYTKLSNKVKDNLTNNFWEGEIKTQGDRVRIVVPNPDAININAGDACPLPQGVAPEALDLVINKVRTFALAITDKEKAQTQFKNYIDAMATAVAQKISKARNVEIIKAAFDYTTANNDDVDANVYNKANHPLAGDYTGAAAFKVTPATAYQFLLQVKMDLLKSGAIADDGTYNLTPLAEEPKEERAVFICGPRFAAILLAAYQLTHATGNGDMVVKDGLVTRVAGMDIHIDRTIETDVELGAGVTYNTSANGTKMPFLAGTKNAFTEASQISEVENIRDPYCFQDNVRGMELYGFKLVHPEALVRGINDPAAEEFAPADGIAAVPVRNVQ